MAVRGFNWKFLIVIVIGLAVLTATAFCLHAWQKNRMAMGSLAGGNKAYALGQWGQAASDLGKYIAVTGRTDVPVLLKYADAQLNIRPLNRDNIQQAISTYRSILRLHPENYEASTRLIRLYLEMDMYGESELIARCSLEGVQDLNIKKMLVMALVGQRKFKDAAIELNAIIKDHPNDIPAYETLCRLCEQHPEEFGKDAAYWLDEAVRKNPSSAMAYIVRGAFEIRKSKTSQAITDFERAQQLDLSQPDVRLRLARELINAGQLSAAEKHLAAVQSIQPKNAQLWQAWALWASKSGIQAQMLKVAKAGLEELSPSNLDFMPAATELYIDGGDYKAAANCIEILSIQNITPGGVAFFKGMIAEHEGKGYQAVKHYRDALQLGYENSRVHIRLAELLSNLGDNVSAIQQMRLLVSEQPDLAGARIYLATLLLHSGRANEAAQEMLKLLRDEPDNVEAKALYAQTQIELFDISNPDASKITVIDGKLNELEASYADKAKLKLLKFQFALKLANFNDAAQLLMELQKIAPDDLDTAVAEVDFLTAQNKPDEAKDRLAAMIKKFPESVAALRYMVMMLDAAGRHEECLSALTEATARIKNAAAQRQLQILLARELKLAGKPDEAYEALNALDKRFENDITVKKMLLSCKSIAANTVRAQQLVNEIKNFEGQDGTIWRYEQAKLWLDANDFKNHVSEIASLLMDNLRSNSEDNESRLLLAMTYDKAGQRRQAIAMYREALSRSPRDLRIIIPAVAALYKSGEYDESDIPTVKLLHEKNPNDTDIAIYLASLYGQGGDYKAALSVLDRQLAICDPNARIKINIHRAVALHRSGDNAHAGELLKSLIHDDPNDAAVMLAEAGLLKDEQKWDELVEYVSRWNQAYSGSASVVVAVSKNLSADSNNAARTAAEKILRNAIAADRNSPELVNELAGLLYVSGRSVEAMQQYQKLLKLDPNNLTAINNLAWIMCETQGEYAKALELTQNGLRISPDYLDLIDTRGMAYFRLGKIDKAIEDFTRCAKSYPSYASSMSVSYFHLGRAYATLTKKDEAVKYLKLALESNQKVGGLSVNDVYETQNLLDSLLKG